MWVSFSRRYMFSPKSHSVINIIAMVSVIAVAIPTAAMIILLAMFGGLSRTIETIYSSVDADIEIVSQRGQTFRSDAVDLDKLRKVEGVAYVAPYLEQSVIAATKQHRTTLKLRGIDTLYYDVLPIANFAQRGTVRAIGDNRIVLGTAAASTLGVYGIGQPLELYALNRRQISTLLPTNSFTRKQAEVCGIVSINAEIDATLAHGELGFTQKLLNYDNKLSGIAIRLCDGADSDDTQQRLQQFVGEGLKVRTRNEKNASMNALIRLERFAIILIGSFIAIVAAFSIVGAVVMLITDKRRDIATLRAMGADKPLVRKIFVGEGVLLTMLGCAIGLVVGVGFVLGQKYFGWVKIPGNMVFESYPVELTATDTLLVVAVVMVAGWLISRLTVDAKLRDKVSRM